MSDEQLNKKIDVEVPRRTLKDAVAQGLEEKGEGKDKWLWLMFILCVTPNIINGFHISSYVFFSKDPDAFYCDLAHKTNDQNMAGWNGEQIRHFAFPDGLEDKAGCNFYNWTYEHMFSMSYEQALTYYEKQAKPELISCLDMMETDQNYYFHYEQPDKVSIITEWNLVCERNALKSNVQVALSIGKFIGASVFGILSDKYGRKSAFSLAAVIYILSGLLTTLSPNYISLLIGRTGLGFCGAGVFYSLFTLITENAGQKYRSSLSIAYNFSYPIGFLFLAAAAYILPEWRVLSFALTVPSFLLVFHLVFLVESPRYLISKGQYKKAYRMLYGKNPSTDFIIDHEMETEPLTNGDDKAAAAEIPAKTKTFGEKISGVFNEVIKIYGPASLRRKALICHFTWCVTSLTYYMLALNAKNFKSNIYVYTAMTGTVDICGYIVSIFILKWSTRRLSQFSLFAAAGAFLLFVLFVPQDASHIDYIKLAFAMGSRFCITSVYAIMTLHTAEMFPTEVRNSVLGISSTAAHFGSFFAPYIVDLLGPIAWYIPTTICGALVIVAGLLTLLQPETKHINLSDHVDNDTADVEMEDVKKS